MVTITVDDGPARGEREARAMLQETLTRWRRWIHLEVTRTRPYGRDAPTLATVAQEDRERCEAAARRILGLAPGRVDPVDMRQLESLLLDLAARCTTLRSRLASGEVVTDAPLCGLLATQLAGGILLLSLLGAAVGREGGR